MYHRTIRTLSPISILLSALFIFLGSVSTASAQAPNFGIKPQAASKGYFEYTIAAGEKVEDVLLASNPNDAPILLNVRAVRGKTMAAGGITFPEDSSGAAEWVTLQESGMVTVPPTTTLSLPFEVAVPAGTPPGEYVVGFLATPEESAADAPVATEGEGSTESSFRVKVVSQVGVAVIITVPEANRCDMVISSLTSDSRNGRWQLAAGMQNTGNVHFRGTGEVIARPANGGEPVAQKAFDVAYFIPGDTIEYPISLEPYPAAGEYEVEVKLLTDCGFETSFTQLLSISQENVLQAAAEVVESNPPSAASGEAARILAQAELIRSISLLVGVVVALIIVTIVVVIVLRRRKVSGATS